MIVVVGFRVERPSVRIKEPRKLVGDLATNPETKEALNPLPN